MIRFTREEYEQLFYLAGKHSGAGHQKMKGKNVSAFIRKCIFEKTDNPLALKKEVKNLTYQVRKIGVNINQVVTKINSGYGTPADRDQLFFYLKKVEKAFVQLEKRIEKTYGYHKIE